MEGKDKFISEKLSRPIQGRILPLASAFAYQHRQDTPDQTDRGRIYDAESCNNKFEDSISINMEIVPAQKACDVDGCAQQLRVYTIEQVDISSNEGRSSNMKVDTDEDTSVSDKDERGFVDYPNNVQPSPCDLARPKQRGSSVTDISNSDASCDSVDGSVEDLVLTQQFKPWVRYLLGALFFTGLLPEFV